MEVPVVGAYWPLAAILLGWLFYLYVTWNHDYWKKRGIPYVKPIPIFGNIADALLAKKSLGEVYTDLYWKLNGHKFGGLFKLSQPIVMVRDPELIKSVLSTNFSSFHDNDIEIDVNVDPLFGRNPFVLKGQKWKITRNLLTPAFTPGKIKPYFPLIAKACEELKECIEEAGATEFETKEMCARFTTDVVASCAYGINGNALKDPNCEFRDMGKEILEPGFWKNIKLLIVFMMPRLASLLSFGFGNEKVNCFFRRIIKEVITYREENDISRADYLQYLINLKNKRGAVEDNEVVSNGHEAKETVVEKPTFTDEDIAAQASTFFADGFETSSAAFSFNIYCLAVNPDIQDKLRKEVDSVIKKHGGQLTYEGIQEMTYLEKVLSETLRVFPPAPVLFKVCTKPFKLDTPSGGEYTVQPGTPVSVPLYAIHHDPMYFPDPERFDPERFSEENKNNIQRGTYFPFGDGPRMCLGFRFATAQVKAGVASIIHNFEVRPNKRTQNPIVFDPNYFMLASKGGIWLDFVKRTHK